MAAATHEAGHWLILGASSAIARAFARSAAAHGAAVTLAGRDEADMAATVADVQTRHGVEADYRVFDAVDADSHAGFVDAVIAGTNRPLNVFLAFGVMEEQDDIDADFRLAERTIHATYTGAVSVLHRLAPHLERQGQGHVVVLGSVAGDRGRVKNYVYGSAKAGLHAYVQGLRARLYRAGVTVTTVKPGFVDTAMTFGLPGLFLVASPEDVAERCYTLGRKGREMIYLPFFWRGIMLIIRNIPEPIFKRLSI